MNCLESSPSPRYAARIKRFWVIEDDASPGDSIQPVLPDGCPELIFNLSDRFRRFTNDNECDLQPRTIAAGQMTKHLLIGPSGKVSLFGVRFKPAGAFGVFRFPLSQLTDRIECLGDIWGTNEDRLHEQLASATDFHDRVTVFEKYLDELRVLDLASSNEMEYAVHSLKIARTSVRKLARELGWSERRLERRFAERVGISPKLFSRINRFQRMIRFLETGTVSDLAGTAIECGYYDQPHMNREFASFAGTSPTAFRASSHRMSKLFVVGE